ncbi:putative zeatin O-glucosyltransferase-like, partial [Capsicum annuum]
ILQGNEVDGGKSNLSGQTNTIDTVNIGVNEMSQQKEPFGNENQQETGGDSTALEASSRCNFYMLGQWTKECGILTADGLAIEGPEFRNRTPDEMRHLIPRVTLNFIGDGTNEAPALHEADIGFAMGIAGTNDAEENADIIVLDDNFSIIANVANWGRSVIHPFTMVLLLWVNLISDTLGAITLATEPPHERLMSRSHVGREVSLISNTMWRNIIEQSIFQVAILLVFNFAGEQILRLEGSDASVVFHFIIVEFLGTFASTTPLGWELWLLILLGAASLLVAAILKLIPIDDKNI